MSEIVLTNEQADAIDEEIKSKGYATVRLSSGKEYIALPSEYAELLKKIVYKDADLG